RQGAVIQHTISYQHVTDCQDNPINDTANRKVEFWEAWRVIKGNFVPGNGDTFKTVDEGKNRRGWVAIIGHAQYVFPYKVRFTTDRPPGQWNLPCALPPNYFHTGLPCIVDGRAGVPPPVGDQN